MSSTYGDKIKISVFGESHGNGIGVVIDGLPAGFEVDFDRVLTQMARRAPGKDKTATPRKEKDLPKVLSGMLGNFFALLLLSLTEITMVHGIPSSFQR